ncbi:MAG: nucleotidyltransferase family protein [Chloroflexi bacterium]|nr:MAG: nucleotidyltransferase family protein [Chloroflexota bacterium]
MIRASDLLLETLRLRPVQSSAGLRQAWRDVRTDGLAQLVAFEGCSLWLHRRLKELDALQCVHAPFAAWLRQSARRIAAQNLAVDAQRDAVVGILNDLDCAHVLLKGAARRLVTDLYPYADARAVGDVDVLVPEHLAPAAWKGLESAGFSTVPGAERRYAAHHHLAPLSNERRVNVEVHTSTSTVVPPREAWRRMNGSGCTINCGNGATRVAGATELLWHALAHALVESWSYAFRLRFLLDAAAVLASDQDVDWTAIASRVESGELPDTIMARRWLGAAAGIAAAPCPRRLTDDVPAFDLTSALRWRLDVFRLFGRGHHVAEPGLWTMAPLARARRLLVDEGTRAMLGLPLTPPLPGSGPLRRTGRRAAAGAARLCFRSWRLIKPNLGFGNGLQVTWTRA